jgi:hypothetical protein
MVRLVFYGQFVVLAMAFFGIALHYAYFRAMRLRYPTCWDSLRRPGVFNGGWSLLTSVRVIRFLRRKEYQELHDDQFSRLSQLVAGYNVLFLVLFVMFAVAVLVRF